MDENRNNSFNSDLNNSGEFSIEDDKRNLSSDTNPDEGQYRNVYFNDQQPGSVNTETNYAQNNANDQRNVYYGGDYGYMANDPGFKRPKKKSKLAIAIISSVLGVIILFAGAIFVIVQYINPLLQDIKLDKSGTSNKSASSYTIPVESTPDVTNTNNTGGLLSIPQVAKKVSTSVVCVVIRTANGQEGLGSGVIMSADGYIFTNAHVIEGAKTIQIILNDGSKKDAQLVGYDSKTDLAVLKINATGLSAATFGDSDKVVVGESVIAIGNPYGLEFSNTVTNGIISAIRKDILLENQRMSLLQTNAQINPGNSGGPLVNMYGQVIGITSLKIMSSGGTTSEGLGFAIPINTAKPILEELINRGYVSNRPMIGITGNYVDEQYAAVYGFPAGIFIQKVEPNSDAYKKGIRQNDIITKINGKIITSMDQFLAEKEKYKVGQSITLTVYSRGETRDVKIALVENKPNT